MKSLARYKGIYVQNRTNSLSNSHLTKVIFAQLAKKFPEIYEMWKFITVFAKTRHWSKS
jgi:hypothetical protein